MSYSSVLPPEIAAHIIIDYLPDSATRTDLSNISLVSRAWFRPAQSLLHSNVYIATERKIGWLIQKYTLYPHLVPLVTSMHLYGREIRSFSEGLLVFEETMMAEGFEQLMSILRRSIKELHLDSYGWNEYYSRRVLDNFTAVERLILNHIDLSIAPEHLLGLVTGLTNLKSLSVYSTAWIDPPDAPNIEERTASLSQRAKQLSHIDLSPVNLSPSPLNLLSGRGLDWSGLRSLRLGWTANNKPGSHMAITGFLSSVGSQVKELTIGTHRLDNDERSMNVNSPCLEDIIATDAMNFFTSLKRLIFCTGTFDSYHSNRPFEVCHYKDFIGYFHAHRLLKTMKTPSTVEVIEIKILTPSYGSRVPATWYPLRDLIRSSEQFPNLNGEQGLRVINDNGRRENTSSW